MSTFILALALLDHTGAVLSYKPVEKFDDEQACYQVVQPALEAALFQLIDDKGSVDLVKQIREGKIFLRAGCFKAGES